MGNWYQNGEFMAELPFSFQGLLPACEMSTLLKFNSSTHENYRPKHKREASSSSQFLFRDELLNFGEVLVEYDLLVRHVHRDGFGTVPLPFFKLPAHTRC